MRVVLATGLLVGFKSITCTQSPPPPLFLSLLKEDNIQNIKMEYLDSRDFISFLQNVEQGK